MAERAVDRVWEAAQALRRRGRWTLSTATIERTGTIGVGDDTARVNAQVSLGVGLPGALVTLSVERGAAASSAVERALGERYGRDRRMRSVQVRRAADVLAELGRIDRAMGDPPRRARPATRRSGAARELAWEVLGALGPAWRIGSVAFRAALEGRDVRCDVSIVLAARGEKGRPGPGTSSRVHLGEDPSSESWRAFVDEARRALARGGYEARGVFLERRSPRLGTAVVAKQVALLEGLLERAAIAAPAADRPRIRPARPARVAPTTPPPPPPSARARRAAEERVWAEAVALRRRAAWIPAHAHLERSWTVGDGDAAVRARAVVSFFVEPRRWGAVFGITLDGPRSAVDRALAPAYPPGHRAFVLRDPAGAGDVLAELDRIGQAMGDPPMRVPRAHDRAGARASMLWEILTALRADRRWPVASIAFHADGPSGSSCGASLSLSVALPEVGCLFLADGPQPDPAWEAFLAGARRTLARAGYRVAGGSGPKVDLVRRCRPSATRTQALLLEGVLRRAAIAARRAGPLVAT